MLLLILLKGRGKYYLVGGTSCLVGGISYAVILVCIFFSTFHITLSPKDVPSDLSEKPPKRRKRSVASNFCRNNKQLPSL